MDRQRLREVNGERSLASQTSRGEISIACVDDSKFSAVLIFFLVNYFLTFLIIGLIAGRLSLINKPKPLRIDVVGEALFLVPSAFHDWNKQSGQFRCACFLR